MRSAVVSFVVLVVAACQPSAAPAAPATHSPAAPPPRSVAPAASTAPSSALGGRIAFQRSGPDAGAYTINPDGSDERLLLAAGQVPRWSPDGALLTVVEVGPDNTVALTVLKPDGSEPRVLHPDPTLNLGFAVWSPDGVWLAVEAWDEQQPGRTGVWILRAGDGSGLRQLTKGPGTPGGFSPDGRELAFVRLS